MNATILSNGHLLLETDQTDNRGLRMIDAKNIKLNWVIATFLSPIQKHSFRLIKVNRRSAVSYNDQKWILARHSLITLRNATKLVLEPLKD